jgi:hypothetical protein
MTKFFAFFLFFFIGIIQAQELNGTVTVNTKKLSNSNLSIFKTLEKSAYEFVNKTKWGNNIYSPKEKISCSFFINIEAYDSDQFTATIQVQSSRPIYNSSYLSPVFNLNDDKFSFRYIEFEPLNFNPNSFDSNLVSVLAYYCNMIIGLDADTFAPQSGTPYYEAAAQIVNTAQSSGFAGWSSMEVKQNRYFLVNDLLSNTFADIRNVLFDYHFKGLDSMSDDLKGGKEKIMNAVVSLEKVHSVRPNSYLMRTFFDAKADEIQSIFSGGPSVNVASLIDVLGKISPLNSSKWSSIKP